MSRLIMYFEQHQPPPIICGPGATTVCMASEREKLNSECCESLDIDPEWLMLTDGMIVASDDAGHRDI